MLDLSVIILTYNEKLHIARAIGNVQPIAREVFVVDSFSTDGTVETALSMGAKVYQNKWENNHARQMNWALDNLPVKTSWVLRLDADEYLTPELIEELRTRLPSLDADVTGLALPRKQYFFGRLVHPLKLLRVFRYGKARSEERWMDEHIQIFEGRAEEMSNMFIDHNLNTLGWWIRKHDNYSVREAIELLDVEIGILPVADARGDIGAHSAAKRRAKARYVRQPLFLRSSAYFIYRYVFKFGFLKGRAQFLWDFFQGWWYRTLVDAKIWEVKRACGSDREKILDYIRDNYGIDCREQ